MYVCTSYMRVCMRVCVCVCVCLMCVNVYQYTSLPPYSMIVRQSMLILSLYTHTGPDNTVLCRPSSVDGGIKVCASYSSHKCESRTETR